MTNTLKNEQSFSELLDRAVHEPGILSAAYHAFHDYSVGNQILAWLQCHDRHLALGPIATFKGWKAKNRHVKRGEKALMLCMPITRKREDKETDEVHTFTTFIYPNKWFVLSQTDGEPLPPVEMPEWNLDRALKTLDVTEVPFDLADGNTQGYAQLRTIAVSPIAEYPHKTRFHELAHVVLGHTTEGTPLTDEKTTPRSLREVEAEAVAMVCGEALDLPGSAESRGYIQHWNTLNGNQPIPEASARKILKAATLILDAGREKHQEVV